MRLTLIAAMAENGVIGRDGDLPWRLPEDWKQFKRRTVDKPCIMGRKTWESLPKRPLPDRLNVVVTRQEDYEAEGATVVCSFDAALDAVKDAPDAVVMGGAELYRLALPHADRMVLTHVEAEVEGDTVFPEVDWAAWRVVARERYPADERHAYAFRVVVYERA